MSKGGKALPTRQLGEILEISHTMVRKYARRGMPTNSAVAALGWLAENTTGRFAGKGAPRPREPDLETDGNPPVSSDPEDEDAPAAARNGLADIDELEGLNQADLTKRLTAARIRLTKRDAEIRTLQGKQHQVDADLRDGKLLRAEEEHRRGFERAVALRTKLLGLPAEWAVQLAAISDPALVADFTRKRIKAALIEYCAAYGVTAEPN